MKEPPKGAVARATAMAEGVAAAVRRRQREREPRVLLYRSAGDPWTLAPGAKGQDRLLELAEELVALVEEPDGRSSRRGRREGREER